MEADLFLSNVTNGFRERKQKDHAEEDRGRLRANPTECRKTETDDQGEDTADNGARGQYPSQPAMNADSALSNIWDELQRTQGEKHQSRNHVKECDSRVLDVSNFKRVGRWWILSHFPKTNRGEDQQNEHGGGFRPSQNEVPKTSSKL